MDNLTARALQNQSNANANYNSKQRREEEAKKLTEAPAFVTGFEGGKYQLERLGQDPVADGVPVTNGLLQVGQRVTTTGQYVDGISRVKPVVPAAPIVAATGKIQYLYSVLNADGSRDLWIGGWQPKPVKIKAIGVNEGGFYLRNTGGRRYFIDYGAGNVVISFTERSELYRYDLTGFGGTVGFYGYSFGADGASGGGPGEHGYWSNLFQGVFSGGLNTDGVGIFGKVYLLPKLLSPVGKIPGLEGLVYRTYAINQSGTKGIGVRIDYDPTLVGGGETIAAYSTPGGIVDTGVNILTIRTGAIDCFDNNFSAIDTSTFSTDVLHKAKFTGSIGLYGFDAIQRRTAKTIVYGIPATQRDSATLIGRPSYHP